MKPKALLTVTSLLAIVLSMLHLADDIAHGISPGKLTNLTPIVFWVVWLWATLLAAERRAGLVVALLASFVAAGVSVVHMTGSKGITAGLAAGSGGFFFAWTILALGVTATSSFLLAAWELWQLRRRPS
jgi:hypothetical protein